MPCCVAALIYGILLLAAGLLCSRSDRWRRVVLPFVWGGGSVALAGFVAMASLIVTLSVTVE